MVHRRLQYLQRTRAARTHIRQLNLLAPAENPLVCARRKETAYKSGGLYSCLLRSATFIVSKSWLWYTTSFTGDILSA